MEINRHFIKEKLDNDSIYIPYTPSNQQIVDDLTKVLLNQNFNSCISKLGIIIIYGLTWEGDFKIIIIYGPLCPINIPSLVFFYNKKNIQKTYIVVFSL